MSVDCMKCIQENLPIIPLKPFTGNPLSKQSGNLRGKKLSTDGIKYSEENLPIIPLESFFGDSLSLKNENLRTLAEFVNQICLEVGCFFISDIPNFDWDLVDSCFKDADRFYHLPVGEKLLYSLPNGKESRGYRPYESNSANKHEGRPDLPDDASETLLFGPQFITGNENGVEHLEDDYFTTPNVYPKNPPELRENFDNLYREFNTVGNMLKKVFSLALGQTPDFLQQQYSQSNFNFLRVSFYPVTTPKPDQDRIAEHTDMVPFTLVRPSSCENSLMVQNIKGTWVFVNPPPKMLFVNIGQTLARISNDQWFATPHKVVFPNDLKQMKERLSLIYFVSFDPDTTVKSLPNFSLTKEKNCDEINYKDSFYIT